MAESDDDGGAQEDWETASEVGDEYEDAADAPPSDEVVSEAVCITKPGFPISTAQAA